MDMVIVLMMLRRGSRLLSMIKMLFSRVMVAVIWVKKMIFFFVMVLRESRSFPCIALRILTAHDLLRH